MDSSNEFNLMVDELVSLTNDKRLKNDLSLFEHDRNRLLKQFLDSKNLISVEKELGEIEKRFRSDIKLTNRLYKLLLEWQKWQTKADIAYSRYRHLSLHRSLTDIYNLEVRSGVSDALPERPVYDDSILPTLESIDREYFNSIKMNIEASISGARRSFTTYITHKWQRELSRHMFDIFIGLVILTLGMGYITTLIPQGFLSLFIIPTMLWVIQRLWLNKWLDLKLEKWQKKNLIKSIYAIFRAKAFVRCYQSGVEDIGSPHNKSKGHAANTSATE